LQDRTEIGIGGIGLKYELDRLIRQFGQRVIVRMGGEEVLTPAFVQPLRYKNKMFLGGTVAETGYSDGAGYLYIGPPEPELSGMKAVEGDHLEDEDGRRYYVVQAEKVYRGREVFYVWAILRHLVEELGSSG